MIEKKPLLILVGPTAVGKTDISISIAKRLNAEIISADSMQIYKYMNIGTAKINEDEKEGIKHYLIDEIYPDNEFTVSDYQSLATKHINDIIQNGKLPMVVGGTGLYINSLVYNLDFTNAISNWELRDKYKNLAEKFGNEYIFKELKEVDPKSAERIHLNDTKRIIRALEIFYETGKPMSSFYNRFREPNPEYDLLFIGLNMNRQKLYDRINRRVDIMVTNGLIEEVMGILEMGYDINSVALQGLGYKEIIKYIKDEYNLEQAIDILKRDTRRFAKRQLTWFRRDERIKWINLDEYDKISDVVDRIIEFAEEKFRYNKIYKENINGGNYFEK